MDGQPQFSWRQWKMGLAVAVVASLLCAGAGLVGAADWKSFVAVFCAALLTHGGAYLKTHPIESITETRTITRQDVTTTSVTTSQKPAAPIKAPENPTA